MDGLFRSCHAIAESARIRRIRKYAVNILLGLFLTTFINACFYGRTTLSMNVNSSNGYVLQKPFILMSGDEASDRFFFILKEQLLNAFYERGLYANAFVYDSLSLETPRSIEKMKTAYGPDVTIHIRQTDIEPYPFFDKIFEILIWKADGTIIWSARLKTGELGRNDLSAELTTEQLIRALEQGGFLRKEPRSEVRK